MRNFALSPDILLPEQKLVLKLSVLTEDSVALIKIGQQITSGLFTEVPKSPDNRGSTVCAFLNTIASKKDWSRSTEKDQH